jgi:hypothetical protein
MNGARLKKSAQVTLTVVAAMALAGCGRRYDPCDPRFFNEFACQGAVQQGGYYYHGIWYGSSYYHPYPYYYDSYHTYVSHGGSVYSSAAGSYSHPSGVSRGGFGSTGSHGSSGS